MKPPVQEGSAISDRLFAGPGEMARLMRGRVWEDGPLGPPEQWPSGLCSALRILLSSRYAMWLSWGPQLISFYNDAFQPILGRKHPWALGQPIKEIWEEIWPVIAPRVRQVLEHAAATWDERLLLIVERHGYKEEAYFTFSYSPLEDGAGGVHGFLAVVTEETVRVLGERRLALLRELASGLAAADTPDAVMTALERILAESRDLPFSITYLFDERSDRARLAARTGIAADHPGAPAVVDLADLGAPWQLHELAEGLVPFRLQELPPGSWPAGPWPTAPTQALLIPIAEPGQSRPAGVFIGGVNPCRRCDDAFCDFVLLLVGQLSAGLSSAGARERERQRAESLAALDRAKTVFFSNVSHEFRTPLTLMLGPLQDLLEGRRGELVAGVRDDLQVVQRNARRMLKLVNNLLDFSRLEAGRLQASFEPLDLAALTADLASVFRSAVERAGLTLTVECWPIYQPVYVDRDMWEKIVLNLLSNALKFTFRGSIELTLQARQGWAVLEVRDTGVGVPAGDLPRLFERFHRVASTRGRSHEGSGIGLALVQELAKMHGGRIEANSAEGVGSTFTVSLPIGCAHLPAERIRRTPAPSSSDVKAFVDEAHQWQAAPAQPQSPDAAVGPYILVADDNADMREYLGRLLGERWQVEVVNDGVAALRAAQARRPDLVLADLMMPVLDGFGLLAALRADPQLRSVPVMMLSALAGEEARVEGLRAGADDYLVKPFSGRELLARVQSQLAAGASRAEAEAELRVRDDFLSLASHELRTPLTTLSLQIDGVLKSLGSDEAEVLKRVPGKMAVLRRQADRLERLVEGLLEVSRIAAGRRELQLEQVDLTAIVREVCERLADEAERAGSALTLRAEGALPGRWDTLRLEQVFTNLLSNAIKYGEGKPIVVSIGGSDAAAVVEVHDEGMGIAVEDQARIFGRFERSPAARGVPGYGLGLWIVRQIVESMDGRVSLNSQAGAGSTFVVELPR